MKKFFEEVAWKISLFYECVVMDIKSYLLKRRIEKARREMEIMKAELNEITNERD